MQTSLATMEERDRMDTLDSVRDSQLSFSADTESESNSSSTCCSSSSSTKTVSLLDRLLHQHFNGSCMRKFQQEKNYYKNNRGSFWELENRIMGRKKRIMCGCLDGGVSVGCMSCLTAIEKLCECECVGDRGVCRR